MLYLSAFSPTGPRRTRRERDRLDALWGALQVQRCRNNDRAAIASSRLDHVDYFRPIELNWHPITIPSVKQGSGFVRTLSKRSPNLQLMSAMLGQRSRICERPDSPHAKAKNCDARGRDPGGLRALVSSKSQDSHQTACGLKDRRSHSSLAQMREYRTRFPGLAR